MTHPVIYYFRLDWVQLVSLLALSLLTWWIHQELWIFLWMIRPSQKRKTGDKMWYYSKKETLLLPMLLIFVSHIKFLNFIINNVPICSIIIYYTRMTNSNVYGEFTAYCSTHVRVILAKLILCLHQKFRVSKSGIDGNPAQFKFLLFWAIIWVLNFTA